MNILNILISTGLTQPKSGARNRCYNITVNLLKNNNIITLEPNEYYKIEDSKITETYCYKNIKIITRNLAIFRDMNLDFIKNIKKILKRSDVDIIIISHPSGMLALKSVLFILGKRIPIFYDAHNVESEFIKETFVNNPKYFWFEHLVGYLNTLFLERIGCKYVADHILCVSNRDREIFIKKYKLNSNKVSVIPSGCNININQKDINKEKIKFKYKIDPSKIVIVFHGLYSHPPNEEAFQLIKNEIAPEFKDTAIFLTGGSNCPVYSEDNFISIGFIENLHEFFSIADIAIVPLRHGAGTKLKVFDYMAAGLPIVTTKKGIEGIEAENGKHVIITEDVNEEFIKDIHYLIDNEKERYKIGCHARKLAEDKYDWVKIGEELNTTIHNWFK